MPQYSKKHLEKTETEKKAQQKTLLHLAGQLAGLGTRQCLQWGSVSLPEVICPCH